MTWALAAPARGLATWERRLWRGRLLRALWPRRRLVLFTAVVALFLASAAHTDRYLTRRDAAADAAGDAAAQSVRPPGSAVDTGSARVGPTDDSDLASYVEARAAELAGATADEQRLAVVSFSRYLTPEEVVALLPAGTVIRFAQIRLPAEEQQPLETEVVSNDLVGSVARVLDEERDRIVEEEEQIASLVESGTVTDPEYAEFYRTELDRLIGTRNLVDAGSGTIYAVVVDAPAASLHTVATHEDVRLVDLAPQGAELARTTFVGLLPEDLAPAPERVTPGG